MKNIAILTENFMGWGGGVDFIKHIILSLSDCAKEKGLKIYVLTPESQSYKKHKGIKKLLYKIKNKYWYGINVKISHPDFSEFVGIKFVDYTKKDLPKVLKELNIDFMFPHMEAKYFNLETQSIGYLYDCQHKYYPEFFTKEALDSRDELFQSLVSAGEKIIVNAHSVKNDLLKFYGAKPENIRVLPLTPKLNLHYLEDYSASIKKYNLAKRYFIISNQFWLHKDHTTAFKAFAELIKNPQYQDIQLICTGLMEDHRRPEYINELKQLIEDLGCKNKIHCLGLIPKLEQIEIMKHSLAVIQPTLFEGGPGGGSVWDAISLGIPAIASDIDTNLEINEKNVFFFKAKDAEDLKSKMETLLSENFEPQSKEKLIEKSHENIKTLGEFLYNLIKEN